MGSPAPSQVEHRNSGSRGAGGNGGAEDEEALKTPREKKKREVEEGKVVVGRGRKTKGGRKVEEAVVQ